LPIIGVGLVGVCHEFQFGGWRSAASLTDSAAIKKPERKGPNPAPPSEFRLRRRITLCIMRNGGKIGGGSSAGRSTGPPMYWRGRGHDIMYWEPGPDPYLSM